MNDFSDLSRLYDSYIFEVNMSTPNCKIPLPKYNPDKPFELFKTELTQWDDVTDIHKTKLGAAIVLTLPDDDKSKHLQTTVLDQITTTKLTAEDGLSELIKSLEKLLGKDDLEDCIIKYDDFEVYSRSVESITDYINQFDSKYTKVKNKGITLPSSVLAFKLLRNSNISNTERKIVLTGMDYEKKDTLYDQAKASLEKYCGEGGSGTLNSTGANARY